MSPQERQSKDLIKLELFFIHRAYRKLAARIDMMDMKSLWCSRPIPLMREWYAKKQKQKQDKFGTTVHFKGETTLPEQCGIFRSSPANPCVYPLTDQNVDQWLALLENLLLQLRNTLFGNSTSLHKTQAPSRHNMSKLLLDIRYLSDVLRSDLFETLDKHRAGQQCLIQMEQAQFESGENLASYDVQPVQIINSVPHVKYTIPTGKPSHFPW